MEFPGKSGDFWCRALVTGDVDCKNSIFVGLGNSKTNSFNVNGGNTFDIGIGVMFLQEIAVDDCHTTSRIESDIHILSFRCEPSLEFAIIVTAKRESCTRNLNCRGANDIVF